MAEFLFAQMAREPIAGRVKTRLIPALGAEQAAVLHARMMAHTWSAVLELKQPCRLWVDGDPAGAAFADYRDTGTGISQQQGADLGERMAHVFAAGLQDYAGVILVGSDCPAIDYHYLQAAADALEKVDAVLGPALDGGYVLIGLRRFSEQLFTGIEWGGESVYRDTVRVLELLQWRWATLAPLPDIDRPEDLQHLPDGVAAIPGK